MNLDKIRTNIYYSVLGSVWSSMWGSVQGSVGRSMGDSVRDYVKDPVNNTKNSTDNLVNSFLKNYESQPSYTNPPPAAKELIKQGLVPLTGDQLIHNQMRFFRGYK